MKKNNILLILLAVISIAIVSIFSTYAFWKYKSTNNAKVNTITHGLDYYINYTKGQDIATSTLEPSTSYIGGNSADIELWKTDDTYTIYGHIYLDINSIGTNLKSSSNLKYTVVNGTTTIATGTLSGSSAGSSKLLAANLPLTTSKTIYKVYIWLLDDSNLNLDMSGETLSVSVRCEATMETITA